MKVILFGATGLAGSAILTELLKGGHKVTAFVRTPSKVKEEHAALKIVQGDVLNEAEVLEAIKGNLAIVSAISEGPQIVQHIQSRGNANIIKAAQQLGLQRIVCMGSTGILQLNEKQLIRDKAYPEAYYPLSEEQFNVYQQLQKSGLQWTQVCPPLILDQPAYGHYLTKASYKPLGKDEVNAGNIGAFIAKELTENKYLQTRVGIINA